MGDDAVNTIFTNPKSPEDFQKHNAYYVKDASCDQISDLQVMKSVVALEDRMQQLLLAGKFKECIELITLISPQLISNNPILGVYKAAAMLLNEFPQSSIRDVLSQIQNSPHKRRVIGQTTAIKAVLHSYTKGPDEGIQLSLQALHELKPDNTFFINFVERNLGVAYALKNDLKNANRWFERLLLSSHKLNDTGGILAAYNYLTYIRKVQGRFNDCAVIYKKALVFIESHHLEFLPHSIKIIAGYGHLLLQWHQIKDAKTYLNRAIQLAKQTDILYAQTAYQNLSEAFVRENKLDRALSVIQESQKQSEELDDLYQNIHAYHNQAIEARIHLEAGKIDKAYEWLTSTGIEEYTKRPTLYHCSDKYGLLVPIAARIYIAREMGHEAIKLLNYFTPKFLQNGAGSYLIRALNAQAVAFASIGEKNKALTILTKTLKLGQKEGNIGDFILIGRDLLPLLSSLEKRGCFSTYTKTLIKALSSIGTNNIRHKLPLQSKSLSSREMEVLTFIAKGMTNREIAVKLYLSASTIKSHSINIYRKLKVNNRVQAVSKARILGILPTENKPAYSVY